MAAIEILKATHAKSKRSGFHHLVTPGRPRNLTPETQRDIFAAVLVVILTAAVVLLARLGLAN